MNIIFEGIDASGKTTLIQSFVHYLQQKEKSVHYIKEIAECPVNSVLKDMLQEDPFFKNHKNFKTSIYETFLLASAFFYKQELLRDAPKGIYIYDRDVFTLLCAQKIVLKEEYGNDINDFYTSLSKCLLFDLKKIDLLVYVSVPASISFKRIEIRDNMILTRQQQKFLLDVKQCFEISLLPSFDQKEIPILYINGENSPDKNILLINEKLKCIN